MTGVVLLGAATLVAAVVHAGVTSSAQLVGDRPTLASVEMLMGLVATASVGSLLVASGLLALAEARTRTPPSQVSRPTSHIFLLCFGTLLGADLVLMGFLIAQPLFCVGMDGPCLLSAPLLLIPHLLEAVGAFVWAVTLVGFVTFEAALRSLSKASAG